jgi:UDP-glucose 4-epimerase
MEKILITGAAGFIGSNTVDAMLAAGHEVVGVDNFRTGKAENLRATSLSPRFRFHRLDVTSSEFGPLVDTERPTAMLHLAALVSVPESFADPALNDLLNVKATESVLRCAVHSGSVRRLVFASSAAIYGGNQDLPLSEDAQPSPLSPYGEAKLRSERLLAAAAASHPSLSTVALRYFNVFGPRQDPRSPYSGVVSIFAEALRHTRPVTIHGDGEQTRDFISVADVARANLAALTMQGNGALVTNVCTGRATSLNILLSTMRHVGDFAAPVVKHSAARVGDVRHSLGTPANATLRLGFTATDDLAAGLRALLSP